MGPALGWLVWLVSADWSQRWTVNENMTASRIVQINDQHTLCHAAQLGSRNTTDLIHPPPTRSNGCAKSRRVVGDGATPCCLSTIHQSQGHSLIPISPCCCWRRRWQRQNSEFKTVSTPFPLPSLPRGPFQAYPTATVAAKQPQACVGDRNGRGTPSVDVCELQSQDGTPSSLGLAFG